MAFFTVKTKAFDTAELNFSKLKEKIDKQVEKKKLGGDAQLRFSAGKGLYAKSETWNVHNLDPFGSGELERADKFRAAREEVAQSVNLSYANQRVNGQLVGHYVVDQILEERARAQLGLAPDDVGDRKQIENVKASLHLRYSDINEVATRITALKTQGKIIKDGRVKLHEGHVPNTDLMSSVGYLGGRWRTQEMAERETRKLIDTMVTDLVEHKWAKAMSPKAREALRASDTLADKEKYHEFDKKFHGDAEAEARSLLHHYVGMKTYYRGHMEEEEELHAVKGGLSTENVAKVGLALRLQGVKDDNVSALLQSVDLPRHINDCGVRLADLKVQLEQSVIALEDSAMSQELEYRIGANNAGTISRDLADVAGAIQRSTDWNRESVLMLKEMSFPDDVTNPEVRRRHYNRLIKNIEDLDIALGTLNNIALRHQSAFANVAQETISNMVDAALDYCAETLELASGVYPGPPPAEAGHMKRRSSSDDDFDRPRPFRLCLPRLMLNATSDEIDTKINKGLDAYFKVPLILFEREERDSMELADRTSYHNIRILNMNKEYEKYRRLVVKDDEALSNDDKAYINNFRKNIITALRDNEKFTELLQRHQAICGAALDNEIDGQLEQAKAQRNALLLLLYPRLTQTDEDFNPLIQIEEDRGLIANDDPLNVMQPQLGLALGNVIKNQFRTLNPDELSDASSDSEAASIIDTGVTSGQGPNNGSSNDQVVIKHVSQDRALGVPEEKPDFLEVEEQNLSKGGDSDDAVKARGRIGSDILFEYFAATKGQTADIENPESVDDDKQPVLPGDVILNNQWAQVSNSLRADGRALATIHDESGLWLHGLNSDEFKRVEPRREGKETIGVDVANTLERNNRAVELLDGLNDESERNAAVEKFWSSFKELVEVKGQLKEFIDSQNQRLRPETFKGAVTERKLVKKSVTSAEYALRNIDDLITRTHSTAYILSSPEQRRVQQNGMRSYPNALATQFKMKKPKDYNIQGGAAHNLHAYSTNKTIGADQQYDDKESISNQRLCAGYLQSLTTVEETLKDLERVWGAAQRQQRLALLEQELVPNLNLALESNSNVIELFNTDAFVEDLINEEIMPKDQFEEVKSRLEQDRRNIETLRLDTFVTLHGDALQHKAA
ncbi:MAG: hypothetical protein AAGC95_15360 [Pseudomonadota bacterium]